MTVLALDPGCVDVWWFELDARAHTRARYAAVLDAVETARAARFRFERDRNRFVVGRGTVREILGAYLGCPPAAVRLEYGAHGKPRLDPGHDSALRFNASGSHGLGALAVTVGAEVGVDVEQIREATDYEAIARQHFHPAEAPTVLEAPEGARAAPFFAVWTGKEAYLKALGVGLSGGLEAFSVLVTGDAVRIGESRLESPQALARWSVHRLFPGAGFTGCLVVEGAPTCLRCRRWAD